MYMHTQSTTIESCTENILSCTDGVCLCNSNFTGPDCCTELPPCQSAQDIYFVIDATLSNGVVPFCQSLYATELLTAAIFPGSELNGTRLATYLYPHNETSTDLMVMGVGEYGCEDSIDRLHDLVRVVSFGYRPQYIKSKVLGDITLPKVVINFVAGAINQEIEKNNDLKLRRRVIVIVTDGISNVPENELKSTINNLVGLSSGITLLAAGIYNPTGRFTQDQFREQLTILTNNDPSMVVVEDDSLEFSRQLVRKMAANNAICDDEGMPLLHNIHIQFVL